MIVPLKIVLRKTQLEKKLGKKKRVQLLWNELQI